MYSKQAFLSCSQESLWALCIIIRTLVVKFEVLDAGPLMQSSTEIRLEQEASYCAHKQGPVVSNAVIMHMIRILGGDSIYHIDIAQTKVVRRCDDSQSWPCERPL